jgi:hypothetical protein
MVEMIRGSMLVVNVEVNKTAPITLIQNFLDFERVRACFDGMAGCKLPEETDCFFKSGLLCPIRVTGQNRRTADVRINGHSNTPIKDIAV